MTVRVELTDGTAWEHEADQFVTEHGTLTLLDHDHLAVCSYASATWVYAEVVP